MDVARGTVRRARLTATTPSGGVARERAALSRRPPGGLRDERVLVAAAQEIPRARARAGAALRDGNGARDGADGRASPQACRGVGEQASFLRSGKEAEMTAG